jgi:hypothetical protein
MEPTKPSPWYKKKGYIVAIVAVVALIGIGSLSGGGADQSVQGTQQVAVPASQQQANVINAVSPVQPTTQNTPNLSNDNHYTNTYGNTVHSPAYTQDNSVPAGASARCKDGTYSFSQSRRGTCSHHGGVASWL